MLTRKDADDFVCRFEGLTDQLLADFSSYEDLSVEERQDLRCLLNALDLAIVSELERVLVDKVKAESLVASYVRDLTQILVEVRQAMV